jgi:5-methylcytosine-specific restriction protein B
MSENTELKENEKFKNLEELIKEYCEVVKENPEGLPPYAKFECYKDRPKKINKLIDNLTDDSKSDDEIIDSIMQLWATGGKIYVEDKDDKSYAEYNEPNIIHSISNTTRLQVCIKNNKDSEKGKIINRENLIKFAKAIGKYIKFESFEIIDDEIKPKLKHDLVEKVDFKDIIINNIDAAINEILFWYFYKDDKFPIINSRAKNSRKILNIAFAKEDSYQKISNNLNFNNECMKIIDNICKDEIKIGNFIITKQLMLDQLFYTIDEMKSISQVDKIYKDKEDKIYKFYKKLWNTIKDIKIPSNSDFFEDLLKKSKNIILYGAPGTGKTYTTEENIKNIIEENPNPEINDKEFKRFKRIQFHPSYSYEDFMEGLKPVLVENNGVKNVILDLKTGDFMDFCKKAKDYEESFKTAEEKDKMKYAFFFLIDEINRAELSRVFGELMYTLDKRGNKISTRYSYMKEEEKEFMIPENVYLIGTMNDVDRSIDSFDIALRRRFFWYRLDCDYSVIFHELSSKYSNIGEFGKKDIPESGYLKACYDLNQFITTINTINGKTGLGMGKLYQLGHSYFLNIEEYAKTKNDDKKVKIENKNLKELFAFSIGPLLKEYLRAEYSEEEIEKHLENAEKIFQITIED